MGIFLKKHNKLAIFHCALFFLFFLSGCGTMLSKHGEAVKTTNNYGDVMDCKYLGQVIASSSLPGYGFEKKALISTMNELKNKAAQLGANLLVVQNVVDGNVYTEMTGDAYLCNDP